ncbi:hypothetical protein JCM33374_g6422 [Metschnikowia sp. JCM 33374]|nr:hypothetical protein JCM33374_g6422 [Metschnikowia sp. JCM 33374]
MSQESSTSAFGSLNPILIPHELETSTPINSQRHPNEATYEGGASTARQPSHSILKKAHHTPFNESSLTYKGNEIPREPAIEPNSSYYSVANDASRNPHLQQARAHKVYFSPTKEVVSYKQTPEQDFHVDLMQLERAKDEEICPKEKEPKDLHHARKPSFWSSSALDPRIPYVLSLYLQLFFNVIIVSVVLYLLFIFIKTVRVDIRHKVEMYTADAIQEISLCSRQFYRNRCSNEGTNIRAPALEETCMALEKCMNRDPQQIGKSKITAETFADIVNGFLHPISWKSSILFSGLIIGGVFITNIAFGTYRSRSGLGDFPQKHSADNQKAKETISSGHVNDQNLLEARTPPNPPPQNIRVVEDSTLLFSSPLSGRSSKQN